MTSRWVTIDVCEYGEALVLRGELEANGIPVDLPGEVMIRSDMFMRGGNAFTLEVRVPDSAVEAALALLAPFERDEAQERRATAEFTGEATQELASQQARELDVDRSASAASTRVRWGSTTWWLAPWALVAGVRQGPGANASAAQKRDHVHALVVATLSTVSVVVFVALLVSGMLD